MRATFVLVMWLGCARSASEPAPACEMGKKCSSEGRSCAPQPIGSGWAHALVCQSGTWQELEIAPLPTPASSTK